MQLGGSPRFLVLKVWSTGVAWSVRVACGAVLTDMDRRSEPFPVNSPLVLRADPNCQQPQDQGNYQRRVYPRLIRQSDSQGIVMTGNGDQNDTTNEWQSNPATNAAALQNRRFRWTRLPNFNKW